MKRRIKKKLYREHLNDVALDVSQSSAWRRKLFDSDYGVAFRLDYESLDGVPVFQKEELKKHGLAYRVFKVPHVYDRKHGYDAELDGPCVVAFRFESTEFPQVRTYSWNNPEAR